MEHSRNPPDKGSNSSKKTPGSSSRTQEKSRREEPSSSGARKTLELLDKMKLSTTLDRNSSRNPPSSSQTRASLSSPVTKNRSSSNYHSTDDRSSRRHQPHQTSSTHRAPSSLTSKLDSSNNRHNNVYSQRSTVESSSHNLVSSSRTNKSIYVTDFDRKMASRQPLIDTLLLDERKKQEAWAQTQLKLSGTCVAGFAWNRVKGGGGYICQGTSHMVTDELIAEGKGGYYQNDYLALPDKVNKVPKHWAGPNYPGDFERLFISSRSRTGTRNIPDSPIHSPASASTLQKIQNIQPIHAPRLPSGRYHASRLSNLNLPTASTRSTNSAVAAQSTLKSAYDQKMASRQRQYESLSITERVLQDNWAQAQLRTLPRCAAGYQWHRERGGYRCDGQRHMVTDDLLAEGKGGRFSMSATQGSRANPVWEGPFYGKEILEHMYGPGSKGPGGPIDPTWREGLGTGRSESSIFRRRI